MTGCERLLTLESESNHPEIAVRALTEGGKG